MLGRPPALGRRLALGVLAFGVLAPLAACRPPPAPAAAPATPQDPSADPSVAPTAPAATPGSEEAGWTSVAQEDGITVTSRPSERSPLPVFRGVGVVEGSLLEVLAVITDADRHREWIFACEASSLVARTTATTGIVYNRTATPWPVPDRDVVLHSQLEVVEPERELIVRFSATEHPQRPPEDGVVRMTYLQGHYHLWAEGPQRTRVEYQVDSDPGGRLPTWLAVRGTRDMPLETLRGLRRQLDRTRGTYDDRIEQLRDALRAERSS